MCGLLAYVGPETVVPVASILAAAGGFLLAGWRWIRVGVMRCVRCVTGKAEQAHDVAATK